VVVEICGRGARVRAWGRGGGFWQRGRGRLWFVNGELREKECTPEEGGARKQASRGGWRGNQASVVEAEHIGGLAAERSCEVRIDRSPAPQGLSKGKQTFCRMGPNGCVLLVMQGGMKPDTYTFAAILNACLKADECELGIDVYK
jgi:hypothetical protein